MANPFLLVGGAAIGGAAGGLAGSLMTSTSRSTAYVSNQKRPNLIPSAAEVLSLYRRGFLSIEDTRTQMGYLGSAWGWDWESKETQRDSETWDALDNSMHYTLSPLELSVAANRGVITREILADWLRKSGVIAEGQRDIVEWLRHQLPPISDLIRFMVKESFDKNVVKRLGYDQEYPEKIMEAVAAAQGFGKISDAMPNVPEGFDISYARASWRAHWQPISPTQSYTMLHRVRKPFQTVTGFDPPERPAFTEKDVADWLKVSDYPPAIRDYLIKISYNVFGLRDIRRLYRQKVMDAPRAKEAYQDIGYTPEDSDVLVAGLEYETNAARIRRNANKTETQIFAAYDLGYLSRTSAKDQLVQIYNVLENPATADGLAESGLNAIDLRIKTRLITATVRAIRADYLEGAIEAEAARAALRMAGIQEQRIGDYLQKWSMDLDRPRRAEAAEKIITYYKQGLIEAIEVYGRLMRIGFGDRDARLRIASADREMFKTSDYSEPKPPGKPSSQKHSTSLARLKEWFFGGVMTEEEVRSRLAGMGWPQDDIDRELELWKKSMEPTNGRTEEPA